MPDQTCVRQDGAMPVVDLCDLGARPTATTGQDQVDAAQHAAEVCGWPGRAIGLVQVMGHRVVPVVEFAAAAQRLRSGAGPELSLTTLSLWEQWGTDLGAPEAPVRIVGFVTVDRPWASAMAAARDLRGLGPVMVLRQRQVATGALAQAQHLGAWVVSAGQIAVPGRWGPVSTAVRVPAHRWFEESLFACALSAGLVG